MLLRRLFEDRRWGLTSDVSVCSLNNHLVKRGDADLGMSSVLMKSCVEVTLS